MFFFVSFCFYVDAVAVLGFALKCPTDALDAEVDVGARQDFPGNKLFSFKELYCFTNIQYCIKKKIFTSCNYLAIYLFL